MSDREKTSKQICEEFMSDIKNEGNIDIYQLCAVSRYNEDSLSKWWNYFKALICFVFQTGMLGLMIWQFSYNSKDENYSNNLTKSVAFCASLYISVAIGTWMIDLVHQGLYRIDTKDFTNCPKYVNRIWIHIGLTANCITLLIALIGSNILIHFASNTLDVILNCVAIFFMLDIDDEMIGSKDYQNIRKWFKEYHIDSTESNGRSNITPKAQQIADDPEATSSSTIDVNVELQSIDDDKKTDVQIVRNKPSDEIKESEDNEKLQELEERIRKIESEMSGYQCECDGVGNNKGSKCDRIFYYFRVGVLFASLICAIFAPFVVIIIPSLPIHG